MYTILTTPILISTIALSLVSTSQQLEACTVAASTSSSKKYYIGKNFDWIPSRSYLVENPKGAKRFRFYDQKPWVAKYGSLSFTTIGPGLPISSMNEKGLVVETLVDFDSKITTKQVYDYVSLEWAQYILDNFSNLDEVIRFAQKNPFDQLIEPVHFFICDTNQNCGVFETSDGKIRISSGETLERKSLANRAWKSDHKSYTQNIFPMLGFKPYSSASRFHRVTEAFIEKDFKNPTEVFKALDTSKISPLVQIQIVWDPEDLALSWRKHNNGSPLSELSTSLGDLSSCSTTSQYRDLNAPLNKKIFTKKDVLSTRDHIESVQRWRILKRNPELTKRIGQYILSSTCENI